MSSQRHVVIIGAGVTGLTSAIFLAEAGYKITVVAAHVPGDKSIEYTSPWAGAIWRTDSTPAEPMLCDWDVQTFRFWEQVIEKEREHPELPKSSLKMQNSYYLWEHTPREDLWWSPHVREFRQLSNYHEPLRTINSTQPSDARIIYDAVGCKVPSLDTARYLLWLQENGRALGVEVIKERLPTENGFEGALSAAQDIAAAHGRGEVDCFLNASGLGAARLCNDPDLYPIRGQTVLVKGEAEAARIRYGDGWRAYCIPRPGSGATILGGTREVGVWSEEPDSAVTQQILERNSWHTPELLTGPDRAFEVISVQCGLRPARKGGPRMEKQTVGGKKVVHAYGHAASGYQHSIGSARLVVKLVTETTGGSHVPARL